MIGHKKKIKIFSSAFTLIELLAVIVILAVISLIAVPVMLNVIERARKGAFEDSAYGVISAAKLYYADKSLDGGVTEETFTFPSDTKLKIAGEKPKNGSVVLGVDGKISLVVHNNVWCALKGKDEEKMRIIKYDKNTCKIGNAPTYEVYQNGTAIYYNPTTNTRCMQSEAISTTGTKSGCMKWYAFLDTESSSDVKMILDHNTSGTVSFRAAGSNATEQLKEDTSNWIVTNARFITADEIAEITDAKRVLQWSSDKEYFSRASDVQVGINISGFDFNGKKGEDPKWMTRVPLNNKSEYAWLYNNTYQCLKYGCEVEDNNKYQRIGHSSSGEIFGYWTSSSVNHTANEYYYTDGDENWCVNSGYLTIKKINEVAYAGVRPVITVSKQILS